MRALALALAVVFSVAAADTEKDRMLGKQLAAEYERGATVLADAAVAQYVDGLAQKLSAHADLPYPLMVKVLEAEEARSVPLPGGFFYITSGLIRRAESEAELAGILAHGIGHIALGPQMRQAPDAAKVATIPLVFMGADSGLACGWPPLRWCPRPCVRMPKAAKSKPTSSRSSTSRQPTTIRTGFPPCLTSCTHRWR